MADNWHRCAMCDEWFDPAGDRAAMHEHPEPQSGPPRDAWLSSGLDYFTWAHTTRTGAAWLEYLRSRRVTR